MRMLVTGAAGFIGSNFVRFMLDAAQQSKEPVFIVAFDALTYAGNLANLHGLENNPNYAFVRGDIRNADEVTAAIRANNVDTIVNFAAESHVDRSILDPLAFVRTNVEGTQVLLGVAKAEKIGRYLQISTDEVYGSLGPTGRFSEQSPIQPSSAYSASKAGSDLLVLAAFHTYGLPAMVTRCSNNYGPYQFPEKLIPLFVTNAIQGKKLPLYGDGKQIRSWLHVDDHSRAIVAVLKNGKSGEVYNIGGAPESEKENCDVTDEILSILELPSTLIQHVEDRLGHDRRYAVDFSKIKRELGWEPQVHFSDGLKATVKWYVENQAWWQAVKSGEYQRFYEVYYGGRLRQEGSAATLTQ